MPETWTVFVEGRSYGPYTPAQMKAFMSEGRVVPHSMVCPSGETAPRPASEFRDLGAHFAPTAYRDATIGLPPRPARFGGTRIEAGTGGRAQFIICSEMKSGSVDALAAEIHKLGPAHAVLRETWLLSSEHSLSVIRNALVQKLGKRDVLLIVDAAHNKAAWFNYGPETDARIRQIWNRAPELEATRSSS